MWIGDNTFIQVCLDNFFCGDFFVICLPRDVTGAVLREVVSHGKLMRLEKFEVTIPTSITFPHNLLLIRYNFVCLFSGVSLY